MDDFLLMIFQGEVEFPCRVVRAAAMRLDQELESEPDGPVVEPIHRIWGDVETIMVACANLSKIFWGSRGRQADRREPSTASRSRTTRHRSPSVRCRSVVVHDRFFVHARPHQWRGVLRPGGGLVAQDERQCDGRERFPPPEQ
jgi:hypothetical protein